MSLVLVLWGVSGVRHCARVQSVGNPCFVFRRVYREGVKVHPVSPPHYWLVPDC